MSGKVLIEPAEMMDALGHPKAVIIDTRAPAKFAAGHIPGAINLHDIFTFLATSTPEGMAELRDKFAQAFGAAGLGGEETAILYEESMNSGFGQSCRGYFLLQFLGYEKARILHGGFQAWSAAGLPVSTDAAKPMARAFPLSDAGSSLMLDAAAVKAVLGDENVVLLDVRDVDEWVGTSSSPYGPDFCPRKGRIPGARWLEWYRLMKPSAQGPVFKSADEIKAECHTVGIAEDTPVYLYCFKGARASNSLVALKEAGIKDVRMYFGSWNEWSRDPSLPIEQGPPWASTSSESLAHAAE